MSRLTTDKIEKWMQDHWNANFNYKLMFTHGRIPDSPDRAAAISRNTTPRVVMGGAFETVVMRIQSRGRTMKSDDAEKIAHEIDAFLDGQTNVMVGDTFCTSIYTSNGPRLVNITDPESRYNFTADYTFVSER